MDDGWLVPMPNQLSVLSQKKLELFWKIEPEAFTTKRTEPVVSVVEAVRGGVTVQLASVGAQEGSSVSPGWYGGPAA